MMYLHFILQMHTPPCRQAQVQRANVGLFDDIITVVMSHFRCLSADTISIWCWSIWAQERERESVGTDTTTASVTLCNTTVFTSVYIYDRHF